MFVRMKRCGGLLLALVIVGWLLPTTGWAREYFVAPSGSDRAEGTRERPFRTIQHAADLLQPGDICTVRASTYREWVKPPRGGASEELRVVYRAAAGEKVIIKGSERTTGWRRNDADGAKHLWRVELPDELLGEFNPYRQNLSGGWLKYGKEFHLGAVYLEGESCPEKLTLAEVAATPKTYCIAPAADRVVLFANFGDADPNEANVEINVRECVFFPVVKGLQFITVQGFTMQHAAANWACFRSFQHALLGTYYGKNWIIENNRISDARCTGIVCGNDPSGENEGFEAEAVGHHLVRHNVIERCGQAGIHGFKGWAVSVIEGNLIQDINTRNEFGGYETGGIKLHDAVDVTIRNNVIRRVTGGKGQFAGIWLDWGAQGTRVTGNVVSDLSAPALFVQNTHGGPVMIDNNVFSGLVRCNSANVLFAHNLYAGCEQSSTLENFKAVYWEPHSARPVGVIPLARRNNYFFNNIFVGRGLDTVADAPGYRADWNVFYGGAKKSGWGDADHSREIAAAADVQFTSLENGVEIAFRADQTPREISCPLLTRDFVGVFPLTQQGLEHHDGTPLAINTDLLGKRRDPRTPAAGPIEGLSVGENAIRLLAGPR